jgi:hypothetical protein
VKTVAHELSELAEQLVDHHQEYVTLSELDLLHESFGDGEYPEHGWSYLDVLELLKRLPALAESEFGETRCPAICECYWYTQLLGFLNDVFPRDDGVWVNFEGPMEVFLQELLPFETGKFNDIHQVTEPDAIRLGRLAVLSRLLWNAAAPVERWEALHRFVEDFNERNSEINTLARPCR